MPGKRKDGPVSRAREHARKANGRNADRLAFENTQRATLLMSPEAIARQWAMLAPLAERTHAENIAMRAFGEALRWRSVDPEGHASAALRDAGVAPTMREALLALLDVAP